jgi:hypothetical protein
MKKYLALMLLVFLTGCGMTPEQRMALAEAMNSAGQGMYQGAQQLNQRIHEQNLQNSRTLQPIAPVPVTCFTTYNSLMREYETRCQ